MRPEETFLCQPIRSLQTMLRAIAENDSDYMSVVPDGIYGPDTLNAVTRFQQNNALSATGVTNQETWDAIVEKFNHSMLEQNRAEPLEITMNPNEVMHTGDENANIYLVQAMLQVIGNGYQCLNPPDATGVLDNATALALESFQEMCGLPMTGDLDKTTWKHLALQYPKAADRCNSRKQK